MEPDTLHQVITGVVATTVTGLLAWLGMKLRKVIKNLGKTAQEVYDLDVDAAQAKYIAAQATENKEDDKAEEARLEEAKDYQRRAKLLKAITDVLGEDDPPKVDK